MSLYISNIIDGGRALMAQSLVLYGNQPMPREVYESKKDSLYYIMSGNDIIGYIQQHPMMYCNSEYLAIEEIEIFAPFKHLRYGSKVIRLLQQSGPLLIIDIQDYALDFWLKVMGPDYWDALLRSSPSVEDFINTVQYKGKVAEYFKRTMRT